MSEPILDRNGFWELRMTIYRNGCRVAICDTLADSYDALPHLAETLLSTREVNYTGRYAREADR